MLRIIIKQLWTKRRSNAWIFLELVLVTFFMWLVIDPLYVLLSNRAIEPGYDIENVYRLQIGEYPVTHSRYDNTLASDSLRSKSFFEIYNRLRNYPGVSSSVITSGNKYPLSFSSTSYRLVYDSITVGTQIMEFYKEGNFFEVFRIHDATNGSIPAHKNHTTQTIYITSMGARKLFPEGNAVGKEVYFGKMNEGKAYTVAGVMDDFKFRSTEQPISTAFIPLESIKMSEFPWTAQICFRIRDDQNATKFEEDFKTQFAPQMRLGNFYFLQLSRFSDIYTHSETVQGVTNKFRLQTSLAVFFLICTFLGIAGTFWLRSDSRRGEIGLRMAMGGTRKGILKEFLTESVLLTTVAWFLGLLFSFQQVYTNGFAHATSNPDPGLLQNQFVPHFLIVSFIVYILLLIITLLGTWIPARRATRIEPSEALREE